MGEHRKSFWIIGIALIVFLILLFGSIIGLKITRDGIYDELEEQDHVALEPVEELNYIVRDDGTKENICEDVINAEFDIRGIRISHINIEERDERSIITASIENTTEELIEKASFYIRLYDANDELLTECLFDAVDLEAQRPTMTIKTPNAECANAARVEVELIGEEISGEA